MKRVRKVVTLLCFYFFSLPLKKKKKMERKICRLIYLNLQKVVELLTCGREGLRSAELKVPQLVLCSERNKTTRTAKGPRKDAVFLTSKSEACTVITVLSSVYSLYAESVKAKPLCKGAPEFDRCFEKKNLNSPGNAPLMFGRNH